MGAIYNHLLEMGKYISDSVNMYNKMSEIILNTFTEINTNDSSFKYTGTADQIEAMKRMMRFKKNWIENNILKTSADAKKINLEYNKVIVLINDCKADLNYQLFNKIVDVVSAIKNLIIRSSNDLELISKHLLDYPNSNSDKINLIKKSIENIVIIGLRFNDEQYGKKIINQSSTDLKVLNAISRNINIKDFLQLSHVHKDTIKYIKNNHNITLTIISRVNFSEDKIGDDKTGKEIILELTNELITDRKYSSEEEHLIALKNKSIKELELAILKIFENTIIDIFDSVPNILRGNVGNIFIGLNSKMYSNGVLDDNFAGQYQSSKSNFNNIFINIEFDKELIYALVFNNPKLEKTSKTYSYLIHEFTHGFDWNSNKPLIKPENRKILSANNNMSPSTKIIIQEIFGKEINPNRQCIMLSEILGYLHLEGIAKMSEFFSQSSINKTPTGKEVELIHLEIKGKSILELQEIIKLYKQKSIDANKLYQSKLLHGISYYMALIIFISDYDKPIKYYYNIPEKYHGDSEKMQKYLISKKDIAQKISTKDCKLTIIAYLDEIINAHSILIKKLSLMSPARFLQKFEESCAKLEIRPFLSKEDFIKIENDNSNR